MDQHIERRKNEEDRKKGKFYGFGHQKNSDSMRAILTHSNCGNGGSGLLLDIASVRTTSNQQSALSYSKTVDGPDTNNLIECKDKKCVDLMESIRMIEMAHSVLSVKDDSKVNRGKHLSTIKTYLDLAKKSANSLVEMLDCSFTKITNQANELQQEIQKNTEKAEHNDLYSNKLEYLTDVLKGKEEKLAEKNLKIDYLSDDLVDKQKEVEKAQKQQRDLDFESLMTNNHISELKLKIHDLEKRLKNSELDAAAFREKYDSMMKNLGRKQSKNEECVDINRVHMSKKNKVRESSIVNSNIPHSLRGYLQAKEEEIKMLKVIMHTLKTEKELKIDENRKLRKRLKAVAHHLPRI